MFHLCALSIAYWHILIVILCSSSFAFSPCTNLSVWNLGIYPLELVYEKPRLLCEVHISPKMFVHVAKLGFEGNVPSLLCGIKVDYCTSSKFGSTSCIYYFISSWTSDCGSLLGHLWCSGLKVFYFFINISFKIYSSYCPHVASHVVLLLKFKTILKIKLLR
jgi:hypothetical protein